MSDLVERLRHAATPLEKFAVGVLPTRALYGEAADRIESLEREAEELRRSRDGYAKQDAARYQEARRLALEEAATLIEQRNGLIPDRQEIARAIRALSTHPRKPTEAEGRTE